MALFHFSFRLSVLLPNKGQIIWIFFQSFFGLIAELLSSNWKEDSRLLTKFDNNFKISN